MAIGSLELTLLKAWFLILTLVEIPNIVMYLFQDAKMDGSFSTLRNERPEKRLWCLVLAFLMLSRVQALFYTLSPGVLILTAAVHTLEAFVFGFEKAVHGDNTSNGIFLVILLNAFWFISAAIRVDTN